MVRLVNTRESGFITGSLVLDEGVVIACKILNRMALFGNARQFQSCLICFRLRET